jgi:hypothetical protein
MLGPLEANLAYTYSIIMKKVFKKQIQSVEVILTAKNCLASEKISIKV